MELLDIINDYIGRGGGNEVILDSFSKAWSVINDPQYKKIVCSISGGADSDVMLDLCYKVDKDKKIDYVWFDTGLEYQATKDHLTFLEDKYSISIIREKAIKSIPECCRTYGQPFLSKFISECIGALQAHNFTWTDEPYEVLLERYPRISGYLKWWCNAYEKKAGCEHLPKMFNIEYTKWLKEFLMANPPQFPISKKCCDYAKKKVSKHLIKEYNADMMITGIRKSEGGIRSKSYKTCFDTRDDVGFYRPLMWYKDQDRKEYEETYKVIHSRCYTEYGLDRTGCGGCPYNLNLEEDLLKIEQHEPKLYIAVNNIFKDSYEYTKHFKEFRKMMNRRSKMNKVAPFKKFLETFETDEMRDYCEDMIKLMPDYVFSMKASTSSKYHNATQCQDGGEIYHILMGCQILSYILDLEYIKNKYPKPKQRDAFRVSFALHDAVKLGWNGSKYTVHEHPKLAADWIIQTKPKHDIKSALKDYIARLVISHSGEFCSSPRSNVVLPKPENDEQFLIHVVDILSSRSNLDMIYDEETIKAVEANL